MPRVIYEVKLVILQTNWVIEEHKIKILKICLVWIIKDVGLKICAKFRNNLTKDEGVMVKRANVLPNGLDRRTDRRTDGGTDRPSYRNASHLINGHNYFSSCVVLNYVAHLRLVNVIFLSKYLNILFIAYSGKSNFSSISWTAYCTL